MRVPGVGWVHILEWGGVEGCMCMTVLDYRDYIACG
jgi:hypothetical protein